MSHPLKHLLMSNAPLKVISFILGYASWYLLGTYHIYTTWKITPLSFYDIPSEWTISAPETVTVLLSGTRSHLRNLDRQTLAIHINGKKLKKGAQPISLSSHELFLPPSIKLVHYIPTTILVEIR